MATSPVGQLSSAEQQQPSQVVLSNLEPKSDHAGEPHKGQSQEQINSQGNFACSNVSYNTYNALTHQT